MTHPRALEELKRLIDEGKTFEEIQRLTGISRRTFFRRKAEIKNPRPMPVIPVVAISVETPRPVVASAPSVPEPGTNPEGVIGPQVPTVAGPMTSGVGTHPSAAEVAAHPQFRTVARPKLIPIEQCVPTESELRRRKQQEIHDRNVAYGYAGLEHSAARGVMRDRARRREGGLEDLG